MKHIHILASFCIAVGFAAPDGTTDETETDTASSQPQPADADTQHAPMNWEDVRIGMTKEEVRLHIGEAKSEFPSPSQLVKPVAKSLLTLDEWWPHRFVLATGLAFNRATYGGAKGYHDGWEYPRDPGPVFRPSYYVYFDANGKVVRLSAPADQDRQPLVQISEAPLDRLIPLWEETAEVTVEYDPLLVQNIMVNIEGLEDPHMLEPRVQEACERNGLQLSKVSKDKKIAYTIMKREPANNPRH